MFEIFKESLLFKERKNIQILNYQFQKEFHCFSIAEDEAEKDIFLFQILRQEEKEKWKAFKETLQYGVQMILPDLKGFFGMNIVLFDLGESLKNFDTLTWKQLLLNHMTGMETGEKKIVKYGQAFSLIHKRIPEDFGKIDLNVHLPIFNNETEKMDLWIKQGLKKAASKEGVKEILFQDMGQLPLLDISNQEQQERLKKINFEKENEVLYFSHLQREQLN